jgi:glutathione S-transferase
MITLHHCVSARSFRPLWLLEELGLPYTLRMLPFPPRVHARHFLADNPLGTVPLFVDGAVRSDRIHRHLPVPGRAPQPRRARRIRWPTRLMART